MRNKYSITYEGIPKGYAYHKIELNEDNKPIDFKFLKANRSYENLVGIKRSNFLGKKFTYTHVFLNKDEFDYVAEFGKVALTGQSTVLDFYSRGLQKWLSVFVFNDKYLHFSTIFSETRNMQNRLDKAHYLNKILLDAIPHAALSVKKDRTVIAANKIAKKQGALLGRLCWREYAHCRYISEKSTAYVHSTELNDQPTLCHVCEADNVLNKKEKNKSGI